MEKKKEARGRGEDGKQKRELKKKRRKEERLKRKGRGLKRKKRRTEERRCKLEELERIPRGFYLAFFLLNSGPCAVWEAVLAQIYGRCAQKDALVRFCEDGPYGACCEAP